MASNNSDYDDEIEEPGDDEDNTNLTPEIEDDNSAKDKKIIDRDVVIKNLANVDNIVFGKNKDGIYYDILQRYGNTTEAYKNMIMRKSNTKVLELLERRHLRFYVLAFIGGTDYQSDSAIGKITKNNYSELLKETFSFCQKSHRFLLIFNGATSAGHIKILDELLKDYRLKSTYRSMHMSIGFTVANYKKYDKNLGLVSNDVNYLFGTDKNDFGAEVKFMARTIQSFLHEQEGVPLTVSVVNGGQITAKEFFYLASVSNRYSKFIFHQSTGRFTDGLISSLANPLDTNKLLKKTSTKPNTEQKKVDYQEHRLGFDPTSTDNSDRGRYNYQNQGQPKKDKKYFDIILYKTPRNTGLFETLIKSRFAIKPFGEDEIDLQVLNDKPINMEIKSPPKVGGRRKKEKAPPKKNRKSTKKPTPK